MYRCRLHSVNKRVGHGLNSLYSPLFCRLLVLRPGNKAAASLASHRVAVELVLQKGLYLKHLEIKVQYTLPD